MGQPNHVAKCVSRSVSFLIASATIACAGGDSSGPGGTTPTPTETKVLEVSSATVALGGSIQRRAFLESRIQQVSWKSADPAIATVSKDGVVTGIAAGKTTIEATAPGKKGTGEITVVDLKFDDLVVGGRQACARAEGGPWYCWGDNGVATLGQFSGTPEVCQGQLRYCVATPRIAIGIPSFTKIAISGGGLTCGLGTQGEVACWGRDDDHQYFAPATEKCEIYSGAADVPDSFFTCSHTPSPIPSPVRFSDLTIGLVACGLDNSGAAFCWGDNFFGQLGLPTTGTCDGTPCVPSPQAAVPNLKFRLLRVGDGLTCGITTTNEAYCWGLGASGQRGADVADGDSPNLISGNHSFQDVQVYRDHACGVSVEGDGYCWGLNSFGQLGSPRSAFTAASTPQLVPGGLKFTTITPGLDFTCGLTTGGEPYCWGVNYAGQLGDGTRDDRAAPAPVIGGYRFIKMKSGRHFTCGLTADRHVYCWGSDVFGELGIGEQGAELGVSYNSARPVGVGGIP